MWESLAEYADRTGTPERTARRHASQGKLPGAMRVGRTWIVEATVYLRTRLDKDHDVYIPQGRIVRITNNHDTRTITIEADASSNETDIYHVAGEEYGALMVYLRSQTANIPAPATPSVPGASRPASASRP